MEISVLEDEDLESIIRNLVEANKELINSVESKLNNFKILQAKAKEIREAPVDSFQNELKQKLTDCRKISRDKSIFLTNVTSNLKTSLRKVISDLRLCLSRFDKLTKEQITESLDNILVQANNMNTLFSNILEIARLESGRAEYFLEYFNPVDLIDQVCSQFEAEIKKKHISISINSTESGLYCYLDKNKMSLLISNLVSNAIKYSPLHSNIEISISTVVAKDSNGKYIQMTFKDKGPGLDESKLAEVFDKIIQSSKLQSNNGGGLGLSLCKEIIENHDGKIWAKNTQPSGLIVTVIVPLKSDNVKAVIL